VAGNREVARALNRAGIATVLYDLLTPAEAEDRAKAFDTALLAGGVLADVTAPTLLIVGGRDETVLSLNELALAQLRSENRLEVVPGVSHLFEESGKMEDDTALASQWFTRYPAGNGG